MPLEKTDEVLRPIDEGSPKVSKVYLLPKFAI